MPAQLYYHNCTTTVPQHTEGSAPARATTPCLAVVEPRGHRCDCLKQGAPGQQPLQHHHHQASPWVEAAKGGMAERAWQSRTRRGRHTGGHVHIQAVLHIEWWCCHGCAVHCQELVIRCPSDAGCHKDGDDLFARYPAQQQPGAQLTPCNVLSLASSASRRRLRGTYS